MTERRPQKAKAIRSRSRRSPLPTRGPPHVQEVPIVGIGASAGGLDACRKLVHALPADIGMAFILVQHLDPTHESMMVELLASHTSLAVRQATEGMRIERDHLYVIPPGTYLSVRDGALHLSQPQARHGARLPFDFLLHSLAESCGPRTICVILSGSGSDGSLGLKAVKEKGGHVIAQDPDEASYDGMPRSAIMTGAVDLVLSTKDIPDALVKLSRRVLRPSKDGGLLQGAADGGLSEIIELLRVKTSHDFRLYKQGTLQRRIERRMALVSVKSGDTGRYLDILRKDDKERDLLAKDLLINVTNFFRDPKTFDRLAETIIPELVKRHVADQPLRIWIAGCSTGEETYSLAMLFSEAITTATRNIKLQVFASDVDADAVASAREGLYPEGIGANVSEARLARFFSKEDHSYRVLPELRGMIVFTVQDVLADPPFSRLDFVSCRNLLIYLGAEAQKKVISLFHFALRESGLLLLGNAETISSGDSRFQVVSKADRLYRHVGRPRPGEFSFLMSKGDVTQAPARTGLVQTTSRPAALAELCRRLVMERYAPAAVLINQKNECLFSLGPTDRYLRVAPGLPTNDLLTLARQGIRTKLRSAIQQANQENGCIVIPGGRTTGDGDVASFSIAVQPILNAGEELLLVCFIDDPVQGRRDAGSGAPGNIARVAELERDLEAMRAELQGAIRSLEISSDEQKAVNEETLSANEEFQSTNEELLTSKEELQSLNEELTALNGQLQETLERQRTTANDLQNVLYSTDVATLFLDTQLNIRFFTPATKSLFNVIAGDIGRPLADLRSLAMDSTLSSDARSVLRNQSPIEREIEGRGDAWYLRRISPYRTDNNGVEGVVITFMDITERKQIGSALEAAKRQAELANVAKSSFLAAASHDLRQPLQTLTLLQGLLTKAVEGPRAEKLLARLEDTLGAMSGMLNALLDINQIEAGTVQAAIVDFPVNELLARMRDEFAYHAEAQRLTLRVVRCGLVVRSDPRLLEQMIRNLVSNALKYTRHGKVLLGCRRHEGMMSLEIWDTGIGIPDGELHAIFEEYHQVDNAARERSRGLGLGLSIVKRLGNLLGHPLHVRSKLGKGSVFAVEIACASHAAVSQSQHHTTVDEENAAAVRHRGSVLVIEDDPELREMLELSLGCAGHHVSSAPDGVAALELMTRDIDRPDLILADFNLPNGLDGVQTIRTLREKAHHEIPAIILTGDISTATLDDIARERCGRLNKPVGLDELAQAIQRLLAGAQPTVARTHVAYSTETARDAKPIIFVVDDDSNIRSVIRAMLEDEGLMVLDYASCEAFLRAYRPGDNACLMVDAYLPGMKGLELVQHLADGGQRLSAIVITGNSDVPMAVQAMKAGASDFIEKPVRREELLASIVRALEQSRDATKLSAWHGEAASRVETLTPRQRQIMDLVLAGQPSKNIAADLGVSQRTVENHRASIMKRTGAKSLPALARLALAAGRN